MLKLLTRFYEKSRLGFALAWIGAYCLLNSVANPISAAIGAEYGAHLAINILLTAVLLLWLWKEDLFGYYGLCQSGISAAKFLWYLPLVLFLSHNLWFGVSFHRSAGYAVCYVGTMLCVGLLEEVIFRGLLFRALALQNVKMAVIVSSLTFGLGHLLNLFNGSGMELVTNLCQVVGAVACGFLFVLICHRGGSLIPCIVTHSLNNAVGVFAKEEPLTVPQQLLLSGAVLGITVMYALYLHRKLPKNP